MLRWERKHSKLNVKNGLVVWSMGPSEEFCKSFVDGVAAPRSAHEVPARLRQANGPLQLWVRSLAIKDTFEQYMESARVRAGAEGVPSSALDRAIRTEMMKLLFDEGGFVYTISWDRRWLRIRVQW